MKKIPAIKSVMTPFPYSVDIGATVIKAKELMDEHKIHHLPVTEKGKLVSVITNKDIRRSVEQSNGPLSKDLLVRNICVADAYIVGLSEPLDIVVLHMAKTHIGSALVVKNGKLAGIFTTSDVCRFLAEFLRSLSPGVDGNIAA